MFVGLVHAALGRAYPGFDCPLDFEPPVDFAEDREELPAPESVEPASAPDLVGREQANS